MNTYERHIHEEIKEWQTERRGYIADVANSAVVGAFSYTASLVPPSVIYAVTEAVEIALRKCFSGSLLTTNKTQIIQQANSKFCCNAGSIEDLQFLELEQLDLLSHSYTTSSEVMAVLEGAGMGLGGLVFMLADIPALIMINIRALIQLAFIYGVDATSPEECEYILNIMTLSAADGKEKMEILSHLDSIARSSAHRQGLNIRKQIQDHLIGEAVSKVIHVAHKIAVRLTHAKLMQMIPIIGTAVGAGANFLYTKEIMTYGLMVFRKRWLTTKYRLPPDNLLILHKTLNKPIEPLPTNWVIVPDQESIDEEEEEEFEEDFSTEAEIKALTAAVSVPSPGSGKPKPKIGQICM